MKNIIIYGAGSFAKMLRLYLDRIPEHKVVSFCVDQKYINSSTILDELPLIPFELVEKKYPQDKFHMIIAVGYKNMRVRIDIYNKAKLKGYRFINYIHNSALLDDTVLIGDNNIIFAGSTLEPFVKIGNNNIIWSSVVISHHSNIGSHCFFASKSLIGGNVTVEDNSFLGFNSVCVQNLVLRKETLIGASSLILSDTEPFSKYMGIPALKVSEHKCEGILIN